MVREVRDLELATGRVSLEYRDVSANIQPETVHIRSLDNENSLNVLEQNYRYDLLTAQKLLEKYVGKKVTVYRYNDKTGKDEKLEAEILSAAGGQSVLRIGGEVMYDFPGRLAFPKVPENLIPKPTLVWLLQSSAPKQRVEVSYVTQRISWKADYVLVIDASDRLGELNGWVTLTNRTGTDYENAKLKLVAGDVQKLLPPSQPGYAPSPMAAAPASVYREPQFKEEGFFEYHLYTLQRPTTLLDKEQKQVSLLEAHGVKLAKRLVFRGNDYYYRSTYGEVQSNQKVGVFIELENKKENGLGLPLPKGIIRVYKSDKSGSRQFVGEDAIDHTPRDEKVRIKMGEAFDVVGDRKQMEWTSLGSCTSESKWKVSLRNHKDGGERVQVFEPVGGDWEILESTHKATREDAHTFSFDVLVPARRETLIEYRVRVKWC